jgi:membrane-associated phospholipid phosphatase
MVGNGFGSPSYIVPTVGAFYLYGYLADDHKARRTSLLALESFAISGVMVSGLKMLAERHRPNTGDSPTTWDGPSLSFKDFSFCSGHTASAFSIATVFADQYKDNPFIPPIAYGLATLTGLSRIYSNAHWASDAFFGGALGYFVSKAVLRLHKQDKNQQASRLLIVPQIGKEMTGLSVKYDF